MYHTEKVKFNLMLNKNPELGLLISTTKQISLSTSIRPKIKLFLSITIIKELEIYLCQNKLFSLILEKLKTTNLRLL